MDKQRIEAAIKEIIVAIGEDPEREGLVGTPRRIANMYEELFSGINKDASQHLDVVFTEQGEHELVLVKDIPFYSICEHHFVPFFGKAHLAYLPQAGKLTGLSKLARVVEDVARRPQLQERITSEIADHLQNKLNPKGVLVVLEAEHLCMTMRGVKKPGALTITKASRGVFAEDRAAVAELLAMIKDK